MTYSLVVDPKAIAQAAEIHRYYQGIGQALADRFDRELDACYAYIEQNPTGYQARMRDYRHALVKGFRYRVVYAIRGNLWWSTKCATRAASPARSSGRSPEETLVPIPRSGAH